MVGLYFLSVGLSWFVARRRRERAAGSGADFVKEGDGA
jgi:hypothetical protein